MTNFTRYQLEQFLQYGTKPIFEQVVKDALHWMNKAEELQKEKDSAFKTEKKTALFDDNDMAFHAAKIFQAFYEAARMPVPADIAAEAAKDNAPYDFSKVDLETAAKVIHYLTVDKKAPKEWQHYPVNSHEAERVVKACLRSKEPLPDWASRSSSGIGYYCGPISPFKSNPNGFMARHGILTLWECLDILLESK